MINVTERMQKATLGELMTIPEPAKVREAAKLTEDSNYKFRMYLKGHADEEELDSQFLELHNELFAHYDCSTCRNCCKECIPRITEDEAMQIAGFLHMPQQEFLDQFAGEETKEFPDEPNTFSLTGPPCIFLNEDNTCLIEEFKPGECREFPHTNKPERSFSLLSIVRSASVCPVVFEILERLKLLYGFEP